MGFSTEIVRVGRPGVAKTAKNRVFLALSTQNRHKNQAFLKLCMVKRRKNRICQTQFLCRHQPNKEGSMAKAAQPTVHA